MERISNPFAPGAGAPPPEMAGREGIVEDGIVNIERNKRGLHEKPLLISGLRGVGKTVLLHTFRVYAEDHDYGATFVEASEKGGFLRSLAQELYPSVYAVRAW
uniref:Orc1-like AAA ATPase domain-containing protein n=1 Tax=mine drainage metagenome TaxID=410659 RepID=E6Q0L5_9ZZZZ